jgi:hypothetical protein
MSEGGAMAVCYLCAYMRAEVPQRSDPLPGNDWEWTEALGTCGKCSVWACGVHGTRYGSSQSASFECAICTPAQAVKDAVGIDHNAVAVAAALRAAPAADSVEARSFQNVLMRLAEADRREGWIEEFEGQIQFSFDTPHVGLVAGYPPAMAAAVRDAFSGRELSPRPDAGRIVSGARNLAYQVADLPRGAVRPPLLYVRYPLLIDPVVTFVDFVERTSRG